MAPARSGVQGVADLGRAVLHRLHPQPVRNRPGPLPRPPQPDQARAEEERQVRAGHHRRCLDRVLLGLLASPVGME